MSPEEIQQQFKKELIELLQKYKAEITIEKESIGYRIDEYIQVTFEFRESLFEEHGTGIIPDLKLGSFINLNTL